MISSMKEKFGDWYNHIDKDKHYLVLTNDIDSYLSCLFLHKKFGVEIGGFYDFEALYINSNITEGKEPIYVDADINSGLAFGNHVTALRNPDCINLNKGISQINYTDKYAGSTLMTLYSLYDKDLSRVNELKVLILLTVDVWFKQYFRYRSKWDKWVEVMGMEYLTELFDGLEEQDMYDALLFCGFNRNITIREDGTLFFPINYKGIKEEYGMTIPEPTQVFDTKIQTLKVAQGDLYSILKKRKTATIFSNAMIFNDKVRYSYI